jgi:hypothetical protein
MNHVIHYHLPSKEDEFIETVERHVCYLQEPPILLLMRVRKNGIYQLRMDVLKLESASLPKPQVSNHLHKWWEEK